LGVAGVVTATSFSGSGSNLTGLATTETVRADTLTVAGVSTLTGAVNVDATTDSTSTSTGALIVDGGAAIAKNVYIGAGLSVAGTLTYEDVTNVDSVGLITAKSGVNVSGGQLQVGVAYSVGAAGVATAAGFVGPLTGAVTGNVTGNADTATTAQNLVVVDESSSTNCFPLFAAASATGNKAAFTGTNLTFNSSSGALTATSFVGALTGNVTGTASNTSGATGDFSIADKIIHTGDTNTALRFPAADTITAETGGSERVRVASDGKVGVGTASPRAFLDLCGAAENATLLLDSNDANSNLCLMDNSGSVRFLNYGGEIALRTGGTGAFTGDNERIRVTSTGAVGVGTTNPANTLHLESSSNTYLQISKPNTASNVLVGNANGDCIIESTGGAVKLKPNNASNKFILDTNGRLILGHSASTGLDRIFQVVGTTSDTSSIELIRHTADTAASKLDFSKSRNGTIGSNTVVQANDVLGDIIFRGDDGTDLNSEAVKISALVDGTPGSNDMPGRLVFSTSADGSNSPTERLRIDKEGGFIFSNGALLEKVNITAGKLSGNTNIDLDNGMVHYFTTTESTTSTPNIRVNSSTSLNNIMTAGDVITVTLVTTAAAAGYSANVTIDGNAVTEEWVGGSAPSAGGSDGLDVYSYTIICIHASNTGDSGFKVIANYVNATN